MDIWVESMVLYVFLQKYLGFSAIKLTFWTSAFPWNKPRHPLPEPEEDHLSFIFRSLFYSNYLNKYTQLGWRNFH